MDCLRGNQQQGPRRDLGGGRKAPTGESRRQANRSDSDRTQEVDEISPTDVLSGRYRTGSLWTMESLNTEAADAGPQFYAARLTVDASSANSHRQTALPRVHQAADKEDNSGTRVADQKNERVIGAEDDGLFGHAHGGGAH